jgi:DNA-binding CsgD family transcriptional regulator
VTEFEEALSLTGDIYDAALDPGHWPEILKRIAGFVGGTAAALVSQDIVARKGFFHFSWGDDPLSTRLYFDRYISLNPILVPLMLLKEGDVRSASTLIPIDKFRQTRFYKEWAQPAGYGDATIAVIEKSPAVVTHVTVSHADRDSPVDGKPRRRLELLTPHIRRAIAIGNLLSMRRIEAEALGDAVDALAAAVFLVREDGHLVHANATGRAMLASGNMVCLHDGTINACGASARRTLRETIAEATAGSLAVRPGGVAVPLIGADSERYIAHVLPLVSGRRRQAGRSMRAGAAVFVHKAVLDGLLPIEAVAREFLLSPAELRVLVAVMEVSGSVPDIAAVLGIAEATVKTHLRRLFEKTGTKRQAELIKVVAGYSNPMLRSVGQPPSRVMPQGHPIG